ncbi:MULTISPECIES: hypothetical protein [Yersinia]|uniref:hypothetical protein n=1 Tax=Yersinia TaxID=629 RepID=UPI0005DC325D|nr:MULTISPECIES: hypothetical protein [Yersinia]CNK74197.1 Uncharacterised protein [Yersinia mollaretii]
MGMIKTNNPTMLQLKSLMTVTYGFSRWHVACAVEAYRDEPSIDPTSASYIYAGRAMKQGIKDGEIDKLHNGGRYYCFVEVKP